MDSRQPKTAVVLLSFVALKTVLNSDLQQGSRATARRRLHQLRKQQYAVAFKHLHSHPQQRKRKLHMSHHEVMGVPVQMCIVQRACMNLLKRTFKSRSRLLPPSTSHKELERDRSWSIEQCHNKCSTAVSCLSSPFRSEPLLARHLIRAITYAVIVCPSH